MDDTAQFIEEMGEGTEATNKPLMCGACWRRVLAARNIHDGTIRWMGGLPKDAKCSRCGKSLTNELKQSVIIGSMKGSEE